MSHAANDNGKLLQCSSTRSYNSMSHTERLLGWRAFQRGNESKSARTMRRDSPLRAQKTLLRSRRPRDLEEPVSAFVLRLILDWLKRSMFLAQYTTLPLPVKAAPQRYREQVEFLA